MSKTKTELAIDVAVAAYRTERAKDDLIELGKMAERAGPGPFVLKNAEAKVEAFLDAQTNYHEAVSELAAQED